MSVYCPMGSPSLLNGDFAENVARLGDFSWSVIFSSEPKNGTLSVAAGESSPTVMESFRNATHVFVETVRTNPMQFALSFITAFILALVFSMIINSLITFARRTRKSTIIASFGAAVFFVSLCAWMTLWRLIQDIFIFAFVNFFVISFLFVAFEVIKNRSNYRPSRAELDKFQCLPLKITFIVIGILVFFFSPVDRNDANECPMKIQRLFGEILFWFIFPYLHMAYYSIKLMWTCFTAQEFEMYKNDVYIGKMVKKGEFGWIEHYDEERLLEQKTEMA